MSTIPYCPVRSVTTVRTLSIKDGLDAATVTPGNTPPDVSFTTLVMLAGAQAIHGVHDYDSILCIYDSIYAYPSCTV
jgi:hypothetical protein